VIQESLIAHAPATDAPVVTTALFTLLMVMAAALDLKSRRIPNVLTVAGVVAGLSLRAFGGGSAVIAGCEGVGLGLLLTVPFFFLGALGGGDVKLVAAVGAFLGPRDLLGAALLIGILGGVLALVEAARRGALRTLLVNVAYIVIRWALPDRERLAPTLSAPTRMSIPYGVPIAVGALAWWYWGGNLG
jgi:prepilin peptidase CpaA